MNKLATDPHRTNKRNGQELEVKFQTDSVGLECALNSGILAAASTGQTQKLRSIYFDTSSGELRKNGVVLRIRKNERASPVLTVKSASAPVDGPFLRNEVEVPSPTLRPNLSLLDKTTADSLKGMVGKRPLRAQFETQIKRRTFLLVSGRSKIEVALDDGTVVAGKKRVPLREIELELKGGDETDLYDLAAALAGELPLRLDFVSKGERGSRIAAGELPSPVKARPIRFSRKATLDDAVGAVLSGTLAQFVGNWAALRETENPEAIHQMRISLRRLRTALAMFKRALPCPEFDVLRDEAKRIASALGPARDYDAFREFLEKGPLLHLDPPGSSKTLMAAFEERRAAAYKDARAVIENRDTTLFVLKVQSVLQRRPWLHVEPKLKPEVRAEVFARQALGQMQARVLKRGKGLANHPDEKRHELRLAFKNLRYGAEFFGGLFGRRRTASYVRKVSVLQDLLGAHNDGASAKRFLKKVPARLGGNAETASGFILGWYARGTSRADEDLRKSWKKFKQTRAFWT